MKTHVKRSTETPKMFEKKFMMSIITSIRFTIQQQAINIPQTSNHMLSMPRLRLRTRVKSTMLTTTGRARSQGSVNRIFSVNKKKTNDRKIIRYFAKRWRKRKFPCTVIVRYR